MRHLRIALIVSVIANIFLAGALIGGAAWLHRGRPIIAAGALRVAGSELPQDERRAFRMALHAARRSVRPAIEEARVQKLRAADLLRQPMLDRRAILDALARARAADTTVRAAVENGAVAFAATLPPGDRARLADAMAERARRPRGAR
jgi:uncharacterized membrane protein